jgi:hypothetical protein
MRPKGCLAIEAQTIICNLPKGPVVYDTIFELKKLQLLIKFPFVCLNNLKFIKN